MPARGTTFARYLRTVHVEWCPFKPRAVGPVLFAELHTKQIMTAVPKLNISKALLPNPASEPFPDRAKLGFADGSERVLDLTGLTLRDILEEINSENVRLLQLERDRGKPF